MKKLTRVLPILLALVLLISGIPMTAQAATKTYVATPHMTKILVNGKSVSVRLYGLNHKDTAYVKVRDIANAIKNTDKKFNVSYSSSKKILTLSPGKAYKTIGGENKKIKNIDAWWEAENSDDITKYGSVDIVDKGYYTGIKLYKNSKNQNVKVYVIGEEHYVSLQSLAKIVDFSLSDNSEKEAYLINTKLGYGETDTPTSTPTPTPTGDTTGVLQSPFPNAALITNPKTIEDCKNILAYLILNNKMEYTFDSTISYDDAMKDGGLNDMFSKAEESYNSDHTPELFWGAVHDFHVLIDGNGIGSKITITFTGYDGLKGATLVKQNKDYFVKTQSAVQNLIDTDEITKSMTQAQKAKAIYKWIAFNVTYKEVDGTDLDQTGYAAITKGYTVCTGYTALYNLMCRYVGITEVEGVVGHVEVPHMWTAQVLDGKQVMTDAQGGFSDDGETYSEWLGCSAEEFRKAGYVWNEADYSKWKNAPGLGITDGEDYGDVMDEDADAE